jgi:hypothetical protein
VIDQIRRFKYAQPFEPFDIELSGGQVVRVDTPDHVAFSKIGAGRVSILNDDDTFSVISGLHIVNVGKIQRS